MMKDVFVIGRKMRSRAAAQNFNGANATDVK